MAVAVKICGLNDRAAIDAAVAGGARYLGFVFYPPSPRAVTPELAADLAAIAPGDRTLVGVFVDPDETLLDRVLEQVPLHALQLHGAETPERVRAIRARTGRFVIKALAVAEPEDLAAVPGHAEAADMILFDARAPKEPGRLPGGNGLAFDWRLLQDLRLGRPWLLSGGLSFANLEAAITLCRPAAVDVSSGVERRPGQKDPDKIRQFLDLARMLDTPAPAMATPPSSSCP